MLFVGSQYATINSPSFKAARLAHLAGVWSRDQTIKKFCQTKLDAESCKMFGAGTSKRIKIEASSLVESVEDDLDPKEARMPASPSSAPGPPPVTYKLISPSSGSNNTTTVLTAPMSGQFYVIGNPSEASAATSSRVIAPKATLTINNPGLNVSSSDPLTHSRRIDRRRATHNEVERRRRDTINAMIMQLGKLIPGLDMDDQEKGPPKGGALSKGGILAKACDFVTELTEDNKTLEKRVSELENMAEENERLLATIEELRQENAMLKQQLDNHGLATSNMEDILS